ncbi:VWA domain-containing protein [Halobacillus massiliensis]|uniref:VWA domain-containing protein n=1 Tax=Halobacillus massiliensis TaxID=1926286 RepID=UPI0009E4627A|nr:VWA domain-containing protein [Halobacillus massiliensis]
MKKIACFLLLFVVGVLAGCSESTNNEPEEELQTSETAEAPTDKDSSTHSDVNVEAFEFNPDDTMAWMKAEPGQYSGEAYDEEAVKAEIDQWPEELEAEEYFSRMMALTAEDYREYQETLDSVEVEFKEISASPDEESGEEGNSLLPKLNVQILLDASGSMAGQIDGEVKMDLAKEAIAEFADHLPEDTSVSLRVYGHAGSSEEDGKEISCSTTEEVYPLGEYDKETFNEALDQFTPTGYTPIGLAMEEAADTLKEETGEDVENIIYVVSDGDETCGGDPAAVAEKLHASEVEPLINIIGFDIAESEREALEAIAEAGEGEYFRADTAQDLQETFREERSELIDRWYEWVSENVTASYEQVSEYVDLSNEYSSEAVQLSNEEEQRQRDLTRYMEEVLEDADTIAVRSMISTRAVSMRQHIHEEFLSMRQEAREKGLAIRQQVRERGLEERQELRELD